MLNSGGVFGRLTVLENVRRNLWECQCVCGNKTVIPGHRLLSGNTKSCGCLKRSVLGEASRKHGMANSRLTGYANKAYGVWQAMKDRCANTKRKDYPRYGGRGIKVCERWSSFENFLSDMGEPPEGHTLDRVDNDGDYSPDNCRWATRKEQVYNSSRVKIVCIDGESKALRSWLQHFGLARHTYYQRLQKGCTEVQALKGEMPSENPKANKNR